MLGVLKILYMLITISMMTSAKKEYDAKELDKMILFIGYAICFAIFWAHI